MKYLFSFLLVGLVSCGNDASSNASESLKPKLKEYTIDEVEMPTGISLISKTDTIAFLKKDMTPFTGVVISRYDNGSLYSKRTFKNGQLNGITRIWFFKGQLQKEINYKNNQADGLYQVWYKNGQLFNEAIYKDGELDGLMRVWNRNGQLSQEKIFDHGKLVSGKCWDKNGNEIQC